MSKLRDLVIVATLALAGSSAGADPIPAQPETELAIERHFPSQQRHWPVVAHPELELAIERHFPRQGVPNWQPIPNQPPEPRPSAHSRGTMSVAAVR